jgi:hypothetical protein
MSTTSQVDAGSRPPAGKPHPTHLLALPPEIRLCLYNQVFGKSMMLIRSFPDYFATDEAKRKAIKKAKEKAKEKARLENRRYDDKEKIELRSDAYCDTQRSSQVLRVCKTIYQEALPVLYSNTAFYLYDGANLATLSGRFDRRSVRTVAFRMQVEECEKYMEVINAMKPLYLAEAALPSLTSLQIRIDALPHKLQGVIGVFYKRYIRYVALCRILRIQKSHEKLSCLFDREPQKGIDIGFRLVTSEAAKREDVRA